MPPDCCNTKDARRYQGEPQLAFVAFSVLTQW